MIKVVQKITIPTTEAVGREVDSPTTTETGMKIDLLTGSNKDGA